MCKFGRRESEFVNIYSKLVSESQYHNITIITHIVVYNLTYLFIIRFFFFFFLTTHQELRRSFRFYIKAPKLPDSYESSLPKIYQFLVSSLTF